MSFNNMENYDDMNKLDDVDTDILDSLGINTLNDPLGIRKRSFVRRI